MGGLKAGDVEKGKGEKGRRIGGEEDLYTARQIRLSKFQTENMKVMTVFKLRASQDKTSFFYYNVETGDHRQRNVKYKNTHNLHTYIHT